MRLELPYPPSVNSYYRNVRGRTLISREGRAYRETVVRMCAVDAVKPLDGRLAVRVDAFPPDRRRRDLDNTQKGLLDAMQHAGVYADDSQIDDLRVVRQPPVPGGRVVVTIEALP